jgi:hypothetical protein
MKKKEIYIYICVRWFTVLLPKLYVKIEKKSAK